MSSISRITFITQKTCVTFPLRARLVLVGSRYNVGGAKTLCTNMAGLS
jgi:hypothetical protein